MTPKSRFNKSLPNAYFVDATQIDELVAYLYQREWLTPAQTITSVTRAGDGNMNLVLRVTLQDGTSFVLKQARPWAEKYPSVAAPAERSEVEAEYYRRTATEPAIAACSPRLLQADAESHILMLEDLGQAADLSSLYQQNQSLDDNTLGKLVDYLATLHRHFRQPDCSFEISNRAMRELNAEHIFRFPFSADTGFDLDAVTPGLAAIAESCRTDVSLMARIRSLEQRYLADGNTLLHGDFFPGSILQTASGIKVIDPEFCFFGDAEFDVGVLLAHLKLGAQPQAQIEAALRRYLASATIGFSSSRCWHYAGVEILRRLLGLAQLPLQLDLDAKRALVDTARDWLLRD